MPMVWRVLSVLQTLIDFHDLDLGIPEIAQTHNLRSHGNHYFLFQIKPNRSPLVIRATQNDPKWTGRFFFVARNSLPDGDLISSIWVKKAAIFTDLAPPTSDTEAKLSKFLKIPESDRTFKHPNQVESVGSQESEATMSAHFSLDDIDAETPAKSVPESSKPRIPNLRSKSAKKRKTEEVIDLSDPATEASKAFELLIKSYHEKDDMINDLKKLGLARAAAHDRDSAELAKVKKELKETKSLLNKSMAEADIKLEETRKTLVGETKRDAAIAIFEARIKMATDAAANGFDISLWDVDTWKVKLAKLKCQGPEVVVTSDDIGGKMPKDNRSKPAKTIKPVPSKAAKPTPEEEVVANEDVTMADPVNEVLKDLVEVATDEAAVEGDTLGKDGI